MTVKKQDLDELVGHIISPTTFKHHVFSGDWVIVGKFSMCSLNPDGTWDVWIVSSTEKDLSSRKVTAIIKSLQGDTGPVRRLDGEAFFPKMSLDVLLANIKPLGIRRKRKPVPGAGAHFKKKG